MGRCPASCTSGGQEQAIMANPARLFPPPWSKARDGRGWIKEKAPATDRSFFLRLLFSVNRLWALRDGNTASLNVLPAG